VEIEGDSTDSPTEPEERRAVVQIENRAQVPARVGFTEEDDAFLRRRVRESLEAGDFSNYQRDFFLSLAEEVRVFFAALLPFFPFPLFFFNSF
jgi:hypothetical protein